MIMEILNLVTIVKTIVRDEVFTAINKIENYINVESSTLALMNNNFGNDSHNFNSGQQVNVEIEFLKSVEDQNDNNSNNSSKQQLKANNKLSYTANLHENYTIIDNDLKNKINDLVSVLDLHFLQMQYMHQLI